MDICPEKYFICVHKLIQSIPRLIFLGLLPPAPRMGRPAKEIGREPSEPARAKRHGGNPKKNCLKIKTVGRDGEFGGKRPSAGRGFGS